MAWSYRYREHNQWVRDHVPAAQLLEWQVTDGWQPLCDFLEVRATECPNELPFPRSNSRRQMAIAFGIVRTIAVAYPLLLTLPLWIMWKLLRRCTSRSLSTQEDRAISNKKSQ